METYGSTVQPLLEPSIRPKRSPNIVTPSRLAPMPSRMTPLSPASRGNTRSATAKPIVPNTRLMRNIARQPVPAILASIRKPARIGPPTMARPSAGPKKLKALSIIARVKCEVMMAMPWGMSSAPNAPWQRRAEMSMAGLTDRPHATDASVNPPIPTRNRRRCPYLSPSRPPITSSTPMASA